MLKIENLSYRYPSRHRFTLKQINLQLADGEMLLLAGRSGCGKSTLIKAIIGLLGDEGAGELQGSIYLAGEDVTHWPPEKIGCLAGTVYQSPDDQLFAMTVADEVGFALENQGVDDEVLRRRVSETLALVGLAGFEEYSIHKLSGGQRQRLALASILITKPKLLILDEPVSQMNPQGVQSFMELLTQLNQQEGIAILMIEHRVNELYPYFKRLAIMQEGQLIYDGSLENAWYVLTHKEDAGVREPQNVKLCRLLHLSQLTAENDTVVELIKDECTLQKPQLENKYSASHKLLLEAQNLSYTYPAAPKATLHELNFSLYQGEITALMGFNGAGKSTLMNLIGGLTATKAGKLFFQGRPMDKSLAQIGYLRQEPDLMLLADTVREELSWKNKHITPAEVERLLKKLGLTQYAEDFPLALSKGQRVRVVLGAMLAQKPSLLLLDEPTTGQDEESLKEIKKLLFDYRNGGGSVFICTHDIELASETADRVMLLNQGKILADGATKEILSNRSLLEQAGLIAPELLTVCDKLQIKSCITIEEVARYVRKTAVGGQ